MADITVVASRGRIEETIFQLTLPAGEDLAQNDVVTISTSGKFVKADGNLTTGAYGMIHRAVRVGMPVTAFRIGVIDGLDLSGMAYWDTVYLSDTAGRVGTTAGTNSVVIGKVIPATATDTGTAYDKLLMLDVRG